MTWMTKMENFIMNISGCKRSMANSIINLILEEDQKENNAGPNRNMTSEEKTQYLTDAYFHVSVNALRAGEDPIKLLATLSSSILSLQKQNHDLIIASKKPQHIMTADETKFLVELGNLENMLRTGYPISDNKPGSIKSADLCLEAITRITDLLNK